MKATRTYGAALLVAGALTAVTASAATGAPAPSNFEPASVSFPTASDGVVLGDVPCGEADCTSVVATTNGGRTWATVAAPDAPYIELAEQSPQSISEVTFANPSDGWAFGPALWATTNGAKSWHQEKLSGPVLAMASAGSVAYAVVGRCYQTSPSCGQARGTLEKTTVGSSHWAPVKGMVGSGPVYFAAHGSTVFVAMWAKANGPASIWQSPNGTTWRRHGEACYRPSQAVDLSGLAAGSSSTLFELCAGNPGAGQEEKYVEASTNAGASAHLAGKLPLGGLTDGFTAAGNRDLAVGAVSGATFLYHSANSGKSWAAHTFGDGGAGVNDLQFAGPKLGAAVEGRPGLGASSDRLWLSHDAGSTWSAVSF